MARVLADLVSDAGLHQATPVEDGDPVGDVPDHREVVAEGAGDRDALQLPTGELCGMARRGVGVEPHALERTGDLGSSLCPVQRLLGE
jgi:hypothetical protein